MKQTMKDKKNNTTKGRKYNRKFQIHSRFIQNIFLRYYQNIIPKLRTCSNRTFHNGVLLSSFVYDSVKKSGVQSKLSCGCNVPCFRVHCLTCSETKTTNSYFKFLKVYNKKKIVQFLQTNFIISLCKYQNFRIRKISFCNKFHIKL